jgi:hypothetical protein
MKITHEYINRLIESEEEKNKEYNNLLLQKNTTLLKKLEKALKNEILGKCIEYKDSYMKVTSIKANEDNYIDIYGIELWHHYKGKKLDCAQIYINGIIGINCFHDFYNSIKIIPEDKFTNEYNKLIKIVENGLTFKNDTKVNNKITVKDVYSEVIKLNDKLTIVENEIGSIDTNLNNSLLQYLNDNYLNQYIELVDDNNKPMLYMHVLSIKLAFNKIFHIDGSAIGNYVNNNVGWFNSHYSMSIEESDIEKIKLITEKTYNEALKAIINID